MNEDLTVFNTYWTPCPRCEGTGKSAGGDCPDCRIGDIPTGMVKRI